MRLQWAAARRVIWLIAMLLNLLIPAFAGLLRVLRAGQCRSIKPQLLVKSVWAHAGHLFPPYVQCCAAEFLTYLLDRLTLELGEDGGRIVKR